MPRHTLRSFGTWNAWAQAEMAAVPTAKRRALSSHDSLQYLANAFSITMISVYGWTNKAEPSARRSGAIGRSDPA